MTGECIFSAQYTLTGAVFHNRCELKIIYYGQILTNSESNTDALLGN